LRADARKKHHMYSYTQRFPKNLESYNVFKFVNALVFSPSPQTNSDNLW